MAIIWVRGFKCDVCGVEWTPKKQGSKLPYLCNECKSPRWNEGNIVIPTPQEPPKVHQEEYRYASVQQQQHQPTTTEEYRHASITASAAQQQKEEQPKAILMAEQKQEDQQHQPPQPPATKESFVPVPQKQIPTAVAKPQIQQEEQEWKSKSKRDSDIVTRVEKFLLEEAVEPLGPAQLSRLMKLKNSHLAIYPLQKLAKQGTLKKVEGGKYYHKDNPKIVKS